MRRMFQLLVILLLLPLSALAEIVGGGFTVKPHTYIWNASGSSATQGTGSITGWPTDRTGGTAVCSVAQVTSDLPTGLSPTGSGSAIRMSCVAGAAPSTVGLRIAIPTLSLQAAGNFGFWWHDPTGDSTKYTGPNVLLATDGTLANRFSFACSNVTTLTSRRKGWNLCTYQRGDQTGTFGTANYDTSSFTVIDFQFTPVANQSFVVYLGDFIKGWYTKPQIMVWAADNGLSGYSTMFAYMNAAGRKVPGSYMPSTIYLPSPNGSQLTVSNLLEMQSAGWSIVPHQTDGTALTAMTESEMREEIETVLSVHRAYGFRSLPFYYPAGGAHNDLSDAVMQSYGLLYGNNANSGNGQFGRQIYGGAFNPYNLWSYTADGQLTTTPMITAINNTIKYGGFLGILWHGPSVAGEITAFHETIDYLVRLRDANMIDVTSYEEFFRRLWVGRVSR